MAENSSTAPGMASGTTYTATGSNNSGCAGGGCDVAYAGDGDDRLSGDGPLAGQRTYSVYKGEFARANQTGTITSGTLQGTRPTTRPGRSSCDDSGSLSRVLSVVGG